MILKNALLYNSTQLIIAHNHPAGTIKPSEQDIRLTQKLMESAELMDIRLLDHIIIVGNKFLSMANEGYFL
jgi:DNA repair protein RadC